MVLDDPTYWGQFLKHYVAVVSDCPFVSSRKPTHANAIKRATLVINQDTGAAENQQEGMVNVIWLWKLELADGTIRPFGSTYGYPLN